MPTILDGVRLFRETDADWPARFRYLIDPTLRFLPFADRMQREAREKNREYGWYTARSGRDDSPMLIQVAEEFQHLGPNSQSFHSEFWPTRMREKFDLSDLVYHHVHGNFSVEPSGTDRHLARALNDASPPLWFAQHGQAETGGEVYSHLYGVEALFPPRDDQIS
ncbi:hypothetical protein [uncultured Albimonas sp.]|uniref:hypothetical protein n=1 Tax=uncultured Albimonas sp. TaxID=1331701 RepID=UPI0030EF1717|tara:strand:- start:4496 stop:4990 length:495 start_codon:yes stop_codon:yes gene_type:complete